MKNRRRQRSPNSESSPDEENRAHRVPDAATSCSSPMETSSRTTASKNEPTAAENSKRSWRIYRKLFILLFLAAVLLLLLAYSFLSKLFFLQILTLLPVGLCAYVGLRRNQTLSHRILPLTLVATTVSAQLPTFLGAAIAATAIVAFGLATVPANQPQHSSTSASPLPVLLGTLVLVTVLLTENFMVWVVSATFEPSHSVETAPPPLQDNGQLLLKWFLQDLRKQQVVGLRRMWNVQWGLVACLGASFVIADVYSDSSRHLYRLGCRAVLTLAAARFIRTISFLLTVLPSQHSNCYAEHYPNPPPTDTWEWIWVGLLPASHGGCNDLIISGHATVTSTMASVAASVSKEPLFCLSLWSMVVLDYMVEIYEGFHYSVDMWLGMVIASLLWRVLAPIEANEETMDNAMEPPKTNSPMSIQIVGLYCLPAMVAYLQLTVLPQWTANFLIVAYVLWVAVLHFGFEVRQTKTALRCAYRHYCQHVLFCLLYMALGVYL